MKKIFFVLTAVLLVFVSCEEDQSDATQVVVALQSGEYRQEATSATKILYQLSCSSLSSTLKTFAIKTFDGEKGEKTYVDSMINTAKFNYTFIFDVPEFENNNVEITIRVRAEDVEKNFYELNLWVTVTGGASLLPELSGIVMYSGSSKQSNAFSLNDPSQPFVMALADSADIDIFDLHDETTPETLSREWHTNTDIRFVKANSFNYANATATSIRANYSSSVRQRFATDIKPNDIILIGRNDNACGVIMITDVAENDGIDNDYYRFNIKVLK